MGHLVSIIAPCSPRQADHPRKKKRDLVGLTVFAPWARFELEDSSGNQVEKQWYRAISGNGEEPFGEVGFFQVSVVDNQFCKSLAWRLSEWRKGDRVLLFSDSGCKDKVSLRGGGLF